MADVDQVESSGGEDDVLPGKFFPKLPEILERNDFLGDAGFEVIRHKERLVVRD